MADANELTPSRRKKVVMVKTMSSPDMLQQAQKKTTARKRRVVVARHVEEGAPATGAAIESPTTQTYRYDATGKLIPHSYLADDEDEEDMEEMGDSTVMSLDPRSPTPDVQYSSAASIVARHHLNRGASARSLTRPSLSRGSLGQQSEAPLSAPEARKKTAEATLRGATAARNAEEKDKEDLMRGLAIHERLAMQKEERVRERWEAQQREWQRFKSSMARKLGRDESQLVVSHAEEYREMVEEYDMIQKATPPDQKHGSEYWMMSLRGEGTRYVAIGNIFSGLFCPVKDDDKPLAEVIRRPRRAAGGNSSAAKAAHDNDPKSWRNAPALQHRKRQLRKRIHDLRPHVIDEGSALGLEAIGQDLFQWAARSADGALPVRGGDAGPETDDSPRAEADEAAAAAAAATAAAPGAQSAGVPLVGPRLQLQVMRDAATLPGDEGASIGMGKDEVPGGATAAVRGWPRVLFECDKGGETKAVLRMRNVGTTALYYSWKPVDRGGVTGAGSTIQPVTDDTINEPGNAAAPRGVARFLCATTEGMVLPGASFDFVFTFKSPNAGVFRESWQLMTTPPANDAVSIRIALRGVAVQSDETAPARDALEKRLDERAIQHMCEDILYSVIQDLKPSPPPPTEDEQLAMNKRAFERNNKGLFFIRSVFGDMCDLHARVAADVAAGEAQDGAGESKEPTPEWDGSIASLAALIDSLAPNAADRKAADAEIAAAAAAAEEADAGGKGKKGKAKPKPKAKKGKGKAADEPMELPPLKPLTAEQRARERRSAYHAELAVLTTQTAQPPVETRLEYSIAREVLTEVILEIPCLAGVNRAGLELPLRDDRDEPPNAEQQAAIDAALEVVHRRRRRAERLAAGEELDSDEEESEEEEEEESEEEDEDEDEEAAARRRAQKIDPSLPPDEQYARKMELQVYGRLGEAATSFSRLATAAASEAAETVRGAVGMDIGSKLSVKDIDVAGLTVVVRADLAAPMQLVRPPVEDEDDEDSDAEPKPPVDEASLTDYTLTATGKAKVAAAAATLQHLVDAGAAGIVVLAHQGEPHDVMRRTQPASSLEPVAAALQQALQGCEVRFAPAATSSAIRAALAEESKQVPVVVAENIRLQATERADAPVFALSGRREHLKHSSGHAMLDGTDVAAWSPAYVALWLHSLCPGVTARAAWADYVQNLATKRVHGAALLAADDAKLALWGFSEPHAALVARALAKLRARDAAEAAARALQQQWADDGSGSGSGAGAGAGAGAGVGAAAVESAAITQHELATRRTMQAATAYRAALSGLGQVYVNDCFSVCHTNNSSVVGIRPRGARIAADTPGTAAGLRVAGLNLAAELQAWSSLLQPSKRETPVLAVLGGDNLDARSRMFEHLVHIVDTIAVGGVLGCAWASVMNGQGLGATALPANIAPLIRRLAGLAAQHGVQVLSPVDFVTVDVDPSSAIAAARAAARERDNKILAGFDPDDDEEEEDEEDDEDDDSDDEEVIARRAARAAKAEAAAARAIAVEEATKRAAASPFNEVADASDSGAVELVVEAEYDGDAADSAPGAAVEDGRFVVDIGSDSRELIAEAVNDAATVLWSGPLGVMELEDGQSATREFVEALAAATGRQTTTLAAGGATHAWLQHIANESQAPLAVAHSTAGGAAVTRLLQGGLLPGVCLLSSVPTEEDGSA